MTSSIAIVLITDVVDSTALMQRFGDERRGGQLEDWGASCHDVQVLIAVCFLVDDEAAKGPFPIVRRLGPRARLVVSDARNVNQRSLPGVDGVSP